MTQEDFIKDVGSWDNHRVLLWLALELTKGSPLPVVEYGAGHGSTPFLRQYCEDAGRTFISYESNAEWAEKCGSIYIPDWLTADVYKDCSVALVDSAPGEIRHEIIAILKDKVDVLTVHDSEPAATGYMLDKIWILYSYRVNLKSEGAWASAVSNKIDLTQFDGTLIGKFKIEK